jgi:hypothetical protein
MLQSSPTEKSAQLRRAQLARAVVIVGEASWAEPPSNSTDEVRLSSSSKSFRKFDRGAFALVKMYDHLDSLHRHREGEDKQHGDFKANAGSIEQAVSFSTYFWSES